MNLVTEDGILAPRCPGCDCPPSIALSGQYFCGTEDCKVVMWDPMAPPDRFKATAQPIDLGFLGDELP